MEVADRVVREMDRTDLVLESHDEIAQYVQSRSDLRTKAISDFHALDAALLNDVRTLLKAKKHADMLAVFEQARQHEVVLRSIYTDPGYGILTSLEWQTSLPMIVFERVDRASLHSAFDALDSHLQQSHWLYHQQEQRLTELWEGIDSVTLQHQVRSATARHINSDALDPLQEQLVEASQAVINEGRALLELLQERLDAESFDAVERAYLTASWPRLFDDPGALHEVFKRAEELPHPRDRESLDALANDYRARYWILCRDMVEVLRPVAALLPTMTPDLET
ncbi:MAG: hypothetical protein ACR2GY_08860 [Phycisphaerales bacterium]